MIKTKRQLILVLFSFLMTGIAKSQDVSIEFGPDEIGLNETFLIKLTLSNDKIKSYDQFPEIPSFQKQGLSQASSMNLINGQMSSSNSIIQYYKPSKIGQFTIAPFEVMVNGIAFSARGKRIKVVDAKTSSGLGGGGDPFADFFGRSAEETEFIELEDDAFFALTVDKQEVFAGEGFTMSLAFLMSESNRAEFQFYDPAKQLDAILKKIKPNNAWEENYNISNIDPEQVTINGKRWVRYKVYEASFFPFSEGTIEIPQIGWQMIKYKVAKNPTFFGANRQEDFKTFYSTAKKIKIKPLPPHPLKNEVSVGIYQLRENIDKIEVETGQGFEYNFGISGIGNINAISAPRRLSGANLSTFDPNVRQQINRGYGRVSGLKEYNYYITLNEAAEVALNQHFEWIYFDPQRAVYDTLKPTARIISLGESKLNQSISSQRLGGLYDRIQSEENRFINKENKYYVTTVINALLLLVVALLAAMILRKK